MPELSDQPPLLIRNELESLNRSLDQAIPIKLAGQNLLIATWNIRSFSSLTRKWTALQSDSPKRDLRGLRAICDIISRFDVIAIQEVKGNLRALRDMMNYLGDSWSFLMTDITLGDPGNDERMAFVFDSNRVKPSGLACELVVPPGWLTSIPENALRRQFARTPYAVSFKAGNTTFILVTLHVDYGNSTDERKEELEAIARWMKAWAKRETKWHHNLLTLGDFNIERQGDALWHAFTSTGLAVPAELQDVPKSIFDDESDAGDKFYDQIAWFTSASGSIALNMNYQTGGYFDFLPFVYTDADLTKSSISYRISDHYPLWAEFLI
jgi:endonuclease/exonuclease/phosphatase family metal-dependent hydrolase